MKKRILFIINPISGVQRKAGVARLADELTDRGIYEVEMATTEYAGHASELARAAAEAGVEVVVAVGGDGTVNEVARAIVGTKAALAIVPCGSGNGLARHLQIPMDVRGAIEVINDGVVHSLDYGTINGRPFFCTCGVGFDAFISEKFAEAGKRGPLTYVENTLREGLKYKPETYTICDETGTVERKAFLIACANASQYGNNAFIAPHASMKDGLLDVVVMEPFSVVEAPQVALQLFNGTLPENSHVRMFQTRSLIIKREGAGAAHCDGEPFVTCETIRVELVRGGFNVVVNNRVDSPRLRGLIQQLPDYFKEWTALPPGILKTLKPGGELKRILSGEELRRINRKLLIALKKL